MPPREETLGALAGEEEQRVGSADERRVRASPEGRVRGLGHSVQGKRVRCFSKGVVDRSGWWEQGQGRRAPGKASKSPAFPQVRGR